MTKAGTGPIGADREPDDAELRAALELLDYELDDDGDYGITPCDEVTRLLDTLADDATVVAERGDELAELTGITDRRELLRWVRLVRTELLRRQAYEMNRAADHMGARANWVAVGGMVVNEGGAAHRHLLARAAVARPLVRVRSRGRARRGRRATTRARARSPGREPEAPARPLDEVAA